MKFDDNNEWIIIYNSEHSNDDGSEHYLHINGIHYKFDYINNVNTST